MREDTMTDLECVDTELPTMRLCPWCDLPVPATQHPDEPYCDKKCQDAHIDEALLLDNLPVPYIELTADMIKHICSSTDCKYCE